MPRLTAKVRFLFHVSMAWSLGGLNLAAQPGKAGNEPDVRLEEKFAELRRQLPPPQRHFDGTTEGEVKVSLRREQNYRQLLREKIQDRWFAAFVSTEAADGFAIMGRFQTWKGLASFIVERDALVEVWSYGEGGMAASRRVPATELAEIRRQIREPPLFTTVTYREPATHQIVMQRLEFGFGAASAALAAQQAYQRQCELQKVAREVLGVRDERGQLNPARQWQTLTRVVQEGRFPLENMPPPANSVRDLLAAIEYQVDEFNTFKRPVRLWWESEIQRRVVRDPSGQYTQTLWLTNTLIKEGREVRAFRVRGTGDEIEPVPAPVLGQDFVELRVVNPNEPDPRRWNVLEFGEPEVVRESALAQFSLVSAYLEKRRKEIALKRNYLDLFAEPVFAGLNIGGGIAGVAFPLGAAARLGYNSLVTPWFIPDVPSVKQMRELFRLLAARSHDPHLKLKPAHFLDKADVAFLEAAARRLSDAEVLEYLQSVSDDDLQAMIRIAQMKRIDARVSNLLSIIADAGLVSGWTDHGGVQGAIFNNIYVSVTGEISINYIIASLAGANVATPKSGVSLESLVHGDGPAAAWLQYLNVTVDLRALLNTIARISQKNLADKELRKPVPYAPRLSDLAAYEIHVFGYPLLIYYKRGLMKDDYNSFVNDYAYGLLGATIVEHFKTRADMDAEIRAGNMMPLGYVRVPSVAGGWKESNLAVFAHRIPSGRHKGKTALIIYGLRAYVEQSQLNRREMLRFQEFERVFEEGGVIEQLADAENRSAVAPEQFEPTMHVGPDATRERYVPLLGQLLEWRRHLRLGAWGLTNAASWNALEPMQRKLAAAGIRAVAGAEDPLVSVDRWGSSFVYRKSVSGSWRIIKLSAIPSRQDRERELAKATEAQQVEDLRRAAVAGHGEGIALINAVRTVDGNAELGPLVAAKDGQLIGCGVRPGAAAMDELLSSIDELPVTARSRLQRNQLAATQVELDVDGDGRREEVFVTFEFPPDGEIRRQRTNSFSGVKEVLSFNQGLLRSVTTDRQILELDYDELNQERASRTYLNTGTRERPDKGRLLDETQTIEAWIRDPRKNPPDPYDPWLSKIRLNHVTGEIARDTYGLFPLPFTTIDDQFITSNRFNAYGLLASSSVLDNGSTEEDFVRDALLKLMEPIPGQARFEITSSIPARELDERRDARSEGFQTRVQRRDIVRSLARMVVLDNAHSGRVLSKSWVDTLDGSAAITEEATSDYRDDFFCGIIPCQTTRRSVPGGARFSTMQTTGYDPLTRRLTATELDFTGRTNTLAWDYRWEDAIESVTDRRATTNRFNRTATASTGATFSQTGGEELGRFAGRFDPETRTWRVLQTQWYLPGVTNRTEMEVRSGFGRRVSSRVGELFETRAEYSADGIEQASRTLRRNSVSGRFDVPCQLEDDFQWRDGQRDARVQTYIDGKPYDAFRRVIDAEGRIVVDEVKGYPGLELRSVVSYDRESDRRTRIEEFQNGVLRNLRQAQPAQQQPDGTWRLPVAANPAWGLISTQIFVIGDILGRPIAEVNEKGERVAVKEWFPDSAVPRVSEVMDRHGRPIRRHVTKLNAGSLETIPIDQREAYALNDWGVAALAEEVFTVRGTDIPLLAETSDARTHYKVDGGLSLPWFASDPHGRLGINMDLGATRRTNLLALFDARIERPEAALGSDVSPVMLVTEVDLRGLFFHRVTQRTIDHAGNVLAENVGRIAIRENTNATASDLFGIPVARLQKLRRHYERGWLVETSDARTGGRMLVFTNTPPAPGARQIQVNQGDIPEMLTGVDGVQFDPSEGMAGDATSYFSHRIGSPRLLERNPYLPDEIDVWTAWTTSELDARGEEIFRSETTFDAQGRLRVTRADKVTRAGEPAARISYHISSPEPGALQQQAVPEGTQAIPLDLAGRNDFSGGDFIYLFVTGATNAALIFTDGAGTSVVVRAGDVHRRRHEVSPWPLHSSQVLWVPDKDQPRQGSSIHAPRWLAERQQVIAVSVHELTRAGLDVRRVRGARMETSNAVPANVSVSQVRTVSRDGPFIAQDDGRIVSRSVMPHSSGLTTLVASEPVPSGRLRDAARKRIATIEFDGQTVAVAQTQGRQATIPNIIWLDTTARGGGIPLYALSAKDGDFVERYRSIRLGDAQVSSETLGFAVPRRELIRASIIEDEISPSETTYGEEYSFTVRNQLGVMIASRAWESVRQRVEANVFRFGIERGLEMFSDYRPATNLFSAFDSQSPPDAETLARNIDQLPLASAALTRSRDLPWASGIDNPTNRFAIDWDTLRFSLARRRLVHPTGLIPTAPETASEQYVDTVQEAEVILLATRLGEMSVARDLLEFFWLKSDGGQLALHASYDAVAGTAMQLEPQHQRPRYAPRTAEAQLAIAEAAFAMGVASGDSRWLGLGQGLMDVALIEFRRPRSTNGLPRGFCERPHLPITQRHGFTLWPDAARYPMRSNVRAYLLLRWLNAPGNARWFDQRWNFEIKQALAEQESFLKRVVLPEVERTGVVPESWFEVQNIRSGTTALAAGRSTSAQDWLWFLEAADSLGVPPATARRWLENLARVHGVWVDGVWGLDWQVPLLRLDAISTDLTARFSRVARLMNHEQAAAFAQRHLGAMFADGLFPAVKTHEKPDKALEVGPAPAIHPRTNHLGWPRTVTVYQELRDPARRPWNPPAATPSPGVVPPREIRLAQPEDTTDFIYLAAGCHVAILMVALLWWGYRAFRRWKRPPVTAEAVVPPAVMQRAEERWAKRVLGLTTPPNAEKWRFSNAPVEQNFLIQLRAIYKLILEWRRRANGWQEDDARLAEDGSDPWLNGADEFVSLIGIYMRWVIKAGAKDGRRRTDPLDGNEDSNHIWSRLTMYFSEHLWSLLALTDDLEHAAAGAKHDSLETRITGVLEAMGMRCRKSKFDARLLFNFPANPFAMDLLIIQKPGVNLREVMWEAAQKLNIPLHHISELIHRYKLFKEREETDPIHPYVLEFAKLLPQFGLMGLGAVIWYNHGIGDSPILPYLRSVVVQFGLSPWSLLWAVPLLGGLILTATASLLNAYRFEAPLKQREKATMILEASLSRLFATGYDATARMRSGGWWSPRIYERLGWILRAAGYAGLAVALLRLDTPSLATFLFVKGLIAMWALAEVAAIAVPLTASCISQSVQDWVSEHPDAGLFARLVNRLNITTTQPASPLWLSIKYHAQPSVPTGDFIGLTQAVAFHFLLSATFIFAGIYLCQEVFALWVSDTYHHAEDWKLFLGSLGFWSTMYLLRYGLFLLFTGLASGLATLPLKVTIGSVAILQLVFVLVGPGFGIDVAHFRWVSYAVTALGLGLMLFGRPIHRALFEGERSKTAVADADSSAVKALENGSLGIVYMSGDDLSSLKLTPELLMARWRILRDKLDSDGLRLLCGVARCPDDSTLQSWFQDMRDAETKSGVTLWHPLQLCVTPDGASEPDAGESPVADTGTRLAPGLGLHIAVGSEAQRQRLLVAWHLRRWLVSMMSSAGHSQDTGINLVDIALRLGKEELGPRTVFYLVQNKFDNGDQNRPSQLAYDAGELGQRNKLARLLCAVAPGVRAHCLQNWTPFGFKAGGLTGMDLVHEESLKLSTLLLLDRNATVHDLDALMLDLRLALSDPNVVIVIPGRSTTNALTPIGQGSQMVEEGHRSFLKGMLTVLGGSASEAVGTGWGNILACFYGRVQQALLSPHVKKMPLTSRMRRGTLFADRTEGLIGFGPHAVGISEDLWAVVQTAHNAIALGHRVRFALSRAIWHKIRETWSHSEWLASFPRWAGGYFQMIHDPLMQRINDFGPQSVFARELRANSGRIFLSGPLALLHILAMPLSILLDVTPFVQVLLVLWNVGFVLNQVLTLHALNVYLEGCGFYRVPAVIGAVVSGGCSWLLPGWEPFAPGLILLGFLTGGFFVGLSRWLATRLRDMILFGPQLVLHALGQTLRLSLEFVISGASPEDARSVNMAFRAWAGPREDRPLENFPHFINLRTVIWWIGFPYVALSAIALYNLDLLNTLMLLPLLLFSVSTVAGPFLARPGVGNSMGLWAAVPRTLGWAAAVLFFMTLAWCMTVGGALNWVSAFLCLAVLSFLARATLRYVPYRFRLARCQRKLVLLLVGAGLQPDPAGKLAGKMLQQCATDPAKLKSLLPGAGLDDAALTAILNLADARIAPLLRAPSADVKRDGWFSTRWWSEFSRAHALALLVLFWFFVVPLPARITLSASDYHLTFGLDKLLLVGATALGVILLSAWIGRLIQRVDLGRGRKTGLKWRLENAFARLEALLKCPGALSHLDTAHSFALLTDVQTYLDQRSHAHARNSLGMVEAILNRAEDAVPRRP